MVISQSMVNVIRPFLMADHLTFTYGMFCFLQALAELCEIKFGKTHPMCNLVSVLEEIEPSFLYLSCSITEVANNLLQCTL